MAQAQARVPLSDNLRGAGFMLAAMAAFTMCDAVMKQLIQLLPLYQALTLRGVLTILLMLLVLRLTGGLNLAGLRGARGLITLRSLAEMMGTVLFLIALQQMPLANLSAILQSTPLAVTAGAALFMGEKVGWRRMLAILLGFVGVLLIVRPGTEGMDRYALIGLLTVVFVAMRDLLTRRMPPGVPSVAVALGGGIAVTLVALVLSLREPWQPVPLATLPMILGAAVLLVIGYICSVRVMRLGDMTFTASFRYSALLWALLLGWVFFGELPDGLTLLGAAIVVGSGLFTLLREAGKRRSRVTPGQ